MDSRKKKKGRPGAKQQKAAPQNANRQQPAARTSDPQPQRPQPAAKPQLQRPQQAPKKPVKQLTKREREALIAKYTAEMKKAAKLLDFEHAAFLRDKIKELQ